MKKKLLGILFVLGLLLALPSMVSFAATKAKGSCGADSNEGGADSVKWTLDSTGILSITGSGAMKDYDFVHGVSAPWYPMNHTDIKYVVIGDGVTKIGNDAFFRYCVNLTTVGMANSVTSIGNNAFDNCKNLTSITMPSSVTSIGSAAFVNCTGLTSVTMPEGLTSIGNNAFDGCTNLTSTIPSSVTSIGSAAFSNCESLESVIIPNGVTSIENDTFSGCKGLKSVTIPNSVTSIYGHAFASCKSLESVTIPNSVKRLSGGIFSYCDSLTSVNIPDGVTELNGMFYSCPSLKSITIPNSVTSIGNMTFFGCTHLESVTLPNSITSIGYGVFKACYNLKSVTLSNRLASIVNSTFDSCKSLESVTIPNSVTSIELNAFINCTSLKSVTIPNSVTSIESGAFTNCYSLKSIKIPAGVTAIDARTFPGCTGLTTVTIPNGVTSIGEGAFSSCTGLTTIYIPMHYDTESETYKELDLSSANIPETATKLYYIAGAAGGNITPVTIDSVTYGNGKERSITLTCDIMGNGYVIQSAGEDTGVTINHKSSEVYTLEGSEIYTPVTGGNLAAKCICSGVVTIPGPVDPYANLVISETVTVNGAKLPVTAISGGYTESGYTTVTVPKDVKYINKGAFYTNENLDTIYLPEGCQMESESVPLTTKIVYYKVNKDERGNAVVRTSSTGEEITQVTVSRVDVLKSDQELNLNNIYGKYEITAIDNDAFNKSGKNLHTIILPNSVESINAGVFENCKNLETIYLKEGCTIENEEKIADKNLIYYTDDGATISNAKINIDDFPLELSKINNRCNITTIGENAFKDQVKMKSVTIPATVTSIGTNPFAGCTNLKAITVDGDNGLYKSDNGVLLSDNGTTLVCCPEGFADSTYTTSESVTAIAAQAFADCKNLENVVLRGTVTYVGTDAFTGCSKLMAIYARKDCSIDSTVLNSENIIYYMVIGLVSPKEVTIGKTTEDYSYKLAGGQNCIINRAGTELDLTVLNNTGLYKITCIGTNAFYQADEGEKRNNLKSIIIPEGVTTVNGGFLRYNQCLESVKLPTTLIGTLPKHSITDNKVLKTLTIPHQVTEIDSKAFEATTKLETVYVPSTITDITPITNYSSTANIIYYHTPTEGEKGRYPEIFGEGNEVCIGKHDFADTNYFESHDSSIINREHSVIDLRTMDSNYQIKLICMAAFSRSEDEEGKKDYIEKIIVPEGVTGIDQCAFRWNHGLLSITLPTTLNQSTTMQKYSITDNETLQTLVIPHGVTGMHQETFCNVKGLQNVYVPEDLNVGDITRYSTKATIIKYKVTDGTVSPKKVKITDATLPNGSSPSSMEVYCDEMGDRYVITEVDEGARDKVALNHRGDVEVPAKEVSCTEGGNETYWKCLCGANNYTGKDSEEIAGNLTIAKGHTSLSEVPAKAATFHACGVKAHYKCEKCKALFEDQDAAISTTLEDLVIPEHKGHDFGAYSHDYENQALHADVCALKGTVAATCAICDQTDVKACAEHTKSSHVWEEKITPATCTTEGKAEYTCSLCNEPETKILEIDSNNHTYGEVEYTWSDDYTACTAKRVCNNDANHVETEEATVTSEATQEATCTQAEVTTYTATFNNEAFETQTKDVTGKIDPNNHTNVEKTEAKAATCTEAGNDEYWYCGGCKKYFEDEACTTEITDISEVTRPATGHTNVEKTEAKAATCTKDGNEVYWYCSGCGKYFADEACTTETNISKLTRPATGHTYGEVEYTWSNDYGTCTAKRVCQNDTGHVETENATKITENIIKAATCEGVGKKTYTASFASFGPSESGVVAIPATGHKCNDTWEHNETQHWKVCETCKENVNAASHTDENSDGTCDVCGYVTTPDTYKVSGTVSIWDNTDSNTTRVRLYSSTTSEADIKSDIQHDITDESYAKTCQYDATVLGPEKVEKTNKYTQSFSFVDVKSGNYKLAAWRPAYDSGKHYAYALKLDPIDIDENKTNIEIKTYLYGDANCDGLVTTKDVTVLKKYNAKSTNTLFDTGTDISKEFRIKLVDSNGDGVITTKDVTELKKYNAKGRSKYDNFI